MIQSIFDILSSIGNFISTVFGFLFSLITDAITVLKLIIQAPSFITSSLVWLPASISGLLIAIISFLVIMRIVKYYGE